MVSQKRKLLKKKTYFFDRKNIPQWILIKKYIAGMRKPDSYKKDSYKKVHWDSYKRCSMLWLTEHDILSCLKSLERYNYFASCDCGLIIAESSGNLSQWTNNQIMPDCCGQSGMILLFMLF